MVIGVEGTAVVMEVCDNNCVFLDGNVNTNAEIEDIGRRKDIILKVIYEIALIAVTPFRIIYNSKKTQQQRYAIAD
jgi:hypothetical protein